MLTVEKINQIISSASEVVAPVWPIKSFVAYNPLQGFEKLPFDAALRRVLQLYNCRLYPPRDFFLAAYSKNLVSEKSLRSSFVRNINDFEKQVEYKGQVLDVAQICWKMLINAKEFELSEHFTAKLISDNYRSRSGNIASNRLNAEIIKWCAAFFDEGQAVWNMPNRSEGFFKAWKSLVIYDKIIDKNPVLLAAPDDPSQAILYALKHLEINDDLIEEYLKIHLFRLRGWAGFIKWRQNANYYEWQKIAPATIAEYLAIRLLTEIAIINNPKFFKIENPANNTIDKLGKVKFLLTRYLAFNKNEVNDLSAFDADKIFNAIEKFDLLRQGQIWLEAMEEDYRNSLLLKLKNNLEKQDDLSQKNNSQILPEAQLIFCIDTRSEGYRKAIETTGNYQTFGAAGFFSLQISYKDPASEELLTLCPGLLLPKHQITASNYQTTNKEDISSRLKYTCFLIKKNFCASFAFVAVSGLMSAFIMLRKTIFNHILAKTKPEKLSHLDLSSISLSEKISYGFNFLRSIGLTDNFAKIILLCGHGSATANNLYASSLDCGACSGNHGSINATAMADILNDQEVRSALAAKAINIPNDSVFIGAKHNTTTDEMVTFEDHVKKIFNHQDLIKIKQDLAKAQIINYNRRFDYFDNQSTDRDTDWAQVRPEWGLAGNASFIIANRLLTKKVDLEARSFLHSYDYKKDPDGSVLSAIMMGPMIVGELINYQYYFSSVDNANFGSGSKLTKNMVGKIGVMQGNKSDLMHGLALQSVMKNDKELFHQPLRLTVIIMAPKSRVESIIAKEEILQKLFYNDWLKLIVIEPEDNQFFLFKNDGNFVLIANQF